MDASLAASDRKATTKTLYRILATNHLIPAPFGAIRLDRLRPTDIEALVLRMRTATRVREGAKVRAFADSTIRSVYTVARAALDGAVRDGLLATNPAAAMKRPGVERKEARFLSGDEMRSLLDAASASRYHRALVLISQTGARRGEILALRWDDVDLAAKNIRIRGTLARVDGQLTITEPKTDRSRRTVPLSPLALSALTEQRTSQAAERLHARNEWTPTKYVFTTAIGQPVDPRNLLRVVKSAATKTSLTNVGVHSLRHSAAVALLEGGINIKAVSDLLGHSSIAITGDIYGHTTDDAARAAVSLLSIAWGSQ
ncbi:MAG: site-specific integrase [Actinomycetota bacterium]|nr:site-specific integrase [Actinomycetota bacterium]